MSRACDPDMIEHAHAHAIVLHTHIVSPTCSTCQQQTQTPSQYTTMTYSTSHPVEVIFAADMKMMRMLIGCQCSAACYCLCPMCLVTRDDIQQGHIH